MKLSRYIPNKGDILLIVLAAAGFLALGVGVFGWPSWVPWAAEQRVPVLEAQVYTGKDDLRVETGQGKLDRAIADHTVNTTQITAAERERTNAYIARIEAAPDPVARQLLLREFVCGSRLYATDPECGSLPE